MAKGTSGYRDAFLLLTNDRVVIRGKPSGPHPCLGFHGLLLSLDNNAKDTPNLPTLPRIPRVVEVVANKWQRFWRPVHQPV